MAVVVKFVPDKKGVAGVAVSRPVQQATQKVAGEGKRYAMSISPVDSGEYLTSWEIIPSTTVIAGMRRAAALLMNHSSHAAAVEYGNAATKGDGHHVLQRTLDHLNSRPRLPR